MTFNSQHLYDFALTFELWSKMTYHFLHYFRDGKSGLMYTWTFISTGYQLVLVGYQESSYASNFQKVILVTPAGPEVLTVATVTSHI